MKLLIADDSTFMRIFLKNMLTECGYEIMGEAQNGELAVEKYKQLKPDVVILDINMDVLSGLGALKKIKEYDINAKIIMISSMGQEGIIHEALQSGAKGFLIKPVTKEKVLETLGSVGMGKNA